jgi:peroxiredoxin
MPDVQRAWEDEEGSDLTLVAVDFAESQPTVEEFAERLGLTFPIGMDSSGTITADYRITGFPSHFLVDKNGILRDIRVGLMSEATMREKLDLLRGY